MNASYTIPQFCDAYHFSRVHYYSLKKQGLAPAEIRVGRRVIITRRAAEQWEDRLAQLQVANPSNDKSFWEQEA
ncbi:hypothetical protein [Massilia sp. TN1-12]|uniref:hypothetical protein n=1 Tax=Massilia paldalensis TaxID=3377675 RepID=UPI00384AFFFF